MCRIFADQSPETYGYQARSVRLGGHVTSIRLEQAFWTILEEIAAVQDQPLSKFLTQLHDEILQLNGDTHNFSSLLRCACLTYVGAARSGSLAKSAPLHDNPRIADFAFTAAK